MNLHVAIDSRETRTMRVTRVALYVSCPTRVRKKSSEGTCVIARAKLFSFHPSLSLSRAAIGRASISYDFADRYDEAP